MVRSARRRLTPVAVVLAAAAVLAVVALAAAVTSGSAVFSDIVGRSVMITSADSFPTGDDDEPVTVIVEIETGQNHTTSGAAHTLALDEDGRVWAWGHNDHHQASATSSTSPVQRPTLVPGLPSGKTFTQIAAGWNTSYALASDGTLWSWGGDANGELGNGAPLADSATPVQVAMPSGTTVVQVSTLASTTVARTSAGAVYTWGDNWLRHAYDGTLRAYALGHGWGASGQADNAPAPGQLDLYGNRAVDVSQGLRGGAAVLANGQLMIWGTNAEGEFNGNPNPYAANQAPQMPSGGGAAGLDVVAVDYGAEHVLALTRGGQVYGWGANDRHQIAAGNDQYRTQTQITGFTGSVKKIVAGYGSTSVVSTNGTLWGRGRNEHDQLFLGWALPAGTDVTTLTQSPIATNAQAFTTVYWSAFYLDPDGTIWARGVGTNYALGTGATDNATGGSPAAPGTMLRVTVRS